MSSPRVSVLIPTRNAARYLRECVDSILSQTFVDFEVLFIDDNSTDNTINIIRSYKDPRFVLLKGPCKNLAAALNFGMRQAKGELIARMDADDIAHPERLQKQVDYLDQRPDFGVCGTLFQEFIDGKAIHDHMDNVRYTDLLDGCYVGHPTAMFRSELFRENELFYNESISYSEDYELWTRVIRLTQIGNLPEVLLWYRRHKQSVSVANIAAMHACDLRIKLDMVKYLVGSISSGQESCLSRMFQDAPVNEGERELCVLSLIDAIKHPALCSRLELISLFHRKQAFREAFIRKVVVPELQAINVFVISYNHLSYIKSIVSYFQKAGFDNVTIIDNNSTYQPLLDYLITAPYRVCYMHKNYGHMVLFESSEFRETIDSKYFILTDPDVLPVEETANDFAYVFMEILLRHQRTNKVGFSLKIDDLPDHYQLKDNVISWESHFYDDPRPYGDLTVYEAPIDTTLALYRPRREWRTHDFHSAIRVGEPYAVRHLPWYRDLSRLTEEDLFYRQADTGSSNWNGTMSSAQLHRKYGTKSPEVATDTESEATLSIPFDSDFGTKADYVNVVGKAIKTLMRDIRVKRLLTSPFKKSRLRYRKQMGIAKFIRRAISTASL
jgi:hypothetical protein